MESNLFSEQVVMVKAEKSCGKSREAKLQRKVGKDDAAKFRNLNTFDVDSRTNSMIERCQKRTVNSTCYGETQIRVPGLGEQIKGDRQTRGDRTIR